MKRLLLAALVLTSSAVFAAESAWQTNYDAALKQAAKENKSVLLDFTGSAWCPPCKQMKKDVLSTPEFLNFAKDNLVLFQADFQPDGESVIPGLTKQNGYLAAKFGVNGFPTFIIINSKGKVLAQFSGYRPGGPEGFIAWVTKSIK